MRTRAKSRRLPLLLILVTACVTGTTFAQEYTEQAVKAAFLHRFAAYVEWPNPVPRDMPFTIAVFGADDVVEQLDQLVPRLTIGSRAANVKKVQRASELEGVQVLYIGRGRLRGAQALISEAAHRPVLIVTDEEGGLTSGAIINFVRVGSNLRFEVSLPAAERSGLKLNSGLLAVAIRVEGAESR